MDWHDRRKETGPTAHSPPGGAAAQATEKTRVLVVEEEAALRQIEAACFERIGCMVHDAASWEQALEQARATHLDIALISERVLGDNCPAAFRALRRASGREDLPIVLISEEDTPEALEVERACGCNDYVPRSVSQRELVRRVANLLQIPPRRFLRTMVALSQPSPRTRVEYLGHSRDISRSGILIECAQPLGVDSELPIKFLLPNSNGLVNALARVTRVVRNPLTGQYEVGCRFTEIDAVSQAMIQEFLSLDSSSI
jgi:CheY-like chemotaxis protein